MSRAYQAHRDLEDAAAPPPDAVPDSDAGACGEAWGCGEWPTAGEIAEYEEHTRRAA